MRELSEGICEPCRTGAPPATAEEIAEYLVQLPEWSLLSVEGIERLQRRFVFDDFLSALAFTDRVGELAESQGHHPALLTQWGSVEVSWWTHKINGLHYNDFIMASRTDQLYKSR